MVSAIGCMLVPPFLGETAHGWINSTLNDAFTWLVVFRLIGGIGVGITSVVAPIYISELTSLELSEQQVDGVAVGVFSFLKDNPKYVKELFDGR